MNRAGGISADRNFARLALGAAIVTFMLIVIGAVVRVSESGMGCGTYWPSCNGQIVPDLSDPKTAIATILEYGHRLFALVVGVAAAIVGIQAWRHYRNVPRVFIPAMLGIVLYFLQSGLGAITVALSNEWLSVMLHLANSMLLLACYVIAWLNARPLETTETEPFGRSTLPLNEALFAGALAYAVALVGAIVAGNDALKACGAQFGTSWPLCFGQVWPSNYGPLATLNMAHRIVAGLLGLTLLLMTLQTWRHADRLTRRAVWIADGLYLIQAAFGALVILVPLDNNAALIFVRSLHVTFAAATWWAMVAVSGVTWLQQHSVRSSVAGQKTPNPIARSATISN